MGRQFFVCVTLSKFLKFIELQFLLLQNTANFTHVDVLLWRQKMATPRVGAHPPQPFLRGALSSPRMGPWVMPTLSVFPVNTSAGLKHDGSTENSGGMNFPDNSMSENKKAMLGPLRATEAHFPPQGTEAREWPFPGPGLALSAPETAR